MKQISCGIIITQGDYVLGLKAFGRKDDKLDIPKGGMENLEHYEDTAIRECFEETGLKLKRQLLEDKGLWIYTKEKNIYLFKYNDAFSEIDLTNLVCTSYITYVGKKFPEVVGYEWVNFNQVKNRFYPKLAPIIEKIVL